MTNFGVSVCSAEAERVRQQNVNEVIQSEGLLSTVKVICDWMQCHTSIINTCAQVGGLINSHLHLGRAGMC